MPTLEVGKSNDFLGHLLWAQIIAFEFDALIFTVSNDF